MVAETEETFDSTNETSGEDDNTDNTEETTTDAATEGAEPEYTEHEKKMFDRAKTAETENKTLKEKLNIFSELFRLGRQQKSKPQVLPTGRQVEPKTDELNLTPMDSILLFKANVTEKEDIEAVLDYANYKRISVNEALKTGVIKTQLAEAAEQRRSSAVANTGSTGRRPQGKLSDEQVYARAKSGEVPKTDEEWAQLYRARHALKK